MNDHERITALLNNPDDYRAWLIERAVAEERAGDGDESGYTPLSNWIHARTGRRPWITVKTWRFMATREEYPLPAWAARVAAWFPKTPVDATEAAAQLDGALAVAE